MKEVVNNLWNMPADDLLFQMGVVALILIIPMAIFVFKK